MEGLGGDGGGQLPSFLLMSADLCWDLIRLHRGGFGPEGHEGNDNTSLKATPNKN